MRRPVLVIVVGLLAVLLLGGTAAPASAATTGRYIVVLREDAGSPRDVAVDHAQRTGARVSHVYATAVRGYSAELPDHLVSSIRDDPRVAAVARDTPVGIAATARVQLLPHGVDRVDGEGSSAASGNLQGGVDADVAVLDTGIDVNHPDLNVVGGYNCAGGSTRDYNDRNGHGTHVAGIVGARDDTIGTVGVAPGARLWAVRVLDADGTGTLSSVMCGVDWVAANANWLDVANMSVGGAGQEPAGTGCATGDAYHDAVCRAVERGVAVVAAAGNNSSNVAGFVPAAYSEVITVSALADFDGQPGGRGRPSCARERDDTFASFSNYGRGVDLIAPGVCIASTYAGGGYAVLDGTSMASPHVAGAAALLASRGMSSPAGIRQALVANGTGDWSNQNDPDRIREPLLNAARF